MRLLKQSTTVTVKMGPFLDAGDGVTEETGLSPSFEVSKDGGATFGARSSATAVSHDADGYYNVELDGTDTDTLGHLVVKSHDSANHLPVKATFHVLPANVFDALVDNADVLQVDVTQINGVAEAATLQRLLEAMTVVTLSGGGHTNETINTGEGEATGGHYEGSMLAFATGANEGHQEPIIDYDGAGTFLTGSFPEVPSNGDIAIIV